MTADMARPSVTAMTLNWNNGDDLVDCVASLLRLDYPACNVVVVDNGSSDDSLARLAARFPAVCVVQNGRNLGYAAGVNVGLEHAFARGAGYCLVINSDTIIDRQALTALVDAAESDPKIGLVTGKVYWHSQPNVLQTAGRYSDPLMLQGPHVGSGEVDRGQWDQAQDYDYVDDVYLLVRREVYEQAGGYSPIFPVYWGISDLCARVRRAGFRIVYAPSSKVWHRGVIGNDNVVLSARRVFYLQYHQVPFMWRNASPEQWSAYLKRTFLGLPWQTLRYIRHGDLATLSAHWRGIGGGLLWVARHGRGERKAGVASRRPRQALQVGGARGSRRRDREARP